MQAFSSDPERDDDLSSSEAAESQSDWLSFDADKTAKFCGESVVYLVAWIELATGSPADADDRNDRSVKQINFICHRGESSFISLCFPTSMIITCDLFL